MKKKTVIMLAAVLMALPLAAAEDQKPVPAQKPPVNADHESFQKAHAQRKAQLTATQEKMEKLVQEYNKLKGKKKEAKKAEIAALVSSIREEQLQFNATQLGQFEERLNAMRTQLDADSAPAAKQAWVDEKTAAVIENGGDAKVLFDRMGKGPKGHMGKGPHKGGKGFHGKKFHGKKDFDGPRPPADGVFPVPPPPAEEK